MAYIYTGKRALITGASSGIGRAFAEALARRGMNLLLIARNEEALDELGQELAERYQVEVHILPLDLTEEAAVTHVLEETQGNHWDIDLLINNAGFGNYGQFEKVDPVRDELAIQLNISVPVALCHAYIPLMLNKGEGAIINVSSTSAFQPNPYFSVYGASKAFVQSFSEALWAEYRTRGIRVLALCPGPTRTGFFDADEAASLQELGMFSRMMTAEHVVEQGLLGLERRRSYVVNGRINSLLSNASRVFPRSWMARSTGLLLKPPRQ